MNKPTLIAIVVLLILGGIWLVVDTSPYTGKDEELSDAYAEFIDANFKSTAKIALEKGSGKVELVKKDGSWVVATSYGAPADTEKIDKLIDSLDGLGAGEEIGSSAASHERFEVGPKKGAKITAYDASGNALGSAIVGKTAPGGGVGTTRIFMRFGDGESTYKVETDVRTQASLWGDELEGKNYLEKDVLKLKEFGPNKVAMQVQSVRVTRPDQDDLVIERRFRAKPKPEGEDAKEGEADATDPGNEDTTEEEYYVVTAGTETAEVGSSEEWQARGILDRANTISIDDVVEPKDRAEYGLDAPQLTVSLEYREESDKSGEVAGMKLLFGNATKDDKGEDDGYYFVLDAPGFSDRIYKLGKYRFDGWNKQMSDFLPKKEEETEDVEPGTDGDAHAAPHDHDHDHGAAGEAPTGSEDPALVAAANHAAKILGESAKDLIAAAKKWHAKLSKYDERITPAKLLLKVTPSEGPLKLDFETQMEALEQILDSKVPWDDPEPLKVETPPIDAPPTIETPTVEPPSGDGASAGENPAPAPIEAPSSDPAPTPPPAE